MSEEIIAQAEQALKNGDLKQAVYARKALACVIRIGGQAPDKREQLLQKHSEIYAGIGDLINKAGSLT